MANIYENYKAEISEAFSMNDISWLSHKVNQDARTSILSVVEYYELCDLLSKQKQKMEVQNAKTKTKTYVS